MAYTANKLIQIAKAEIGYKEKASNSNLDNPAANAGNKNYTKYARDLSAAGYYNGNKNGYAWCDVFVDWCFYQLCGKDKAKAEAMEYQTGNLGAGTAFSMGYYKAAGRFDSTPKIGDQVFFKYANATGAASHTGIVIEVTAAQITTVEGNESNAVSKRVYARSNPTIIGYGHPKYDVEQENEKVTIILNQLTKGSKGAEVKTLQRLLKSYGYRDMNGKTLTIDGDFGSKTEYALKAFQKAKGLKVDGYCGLNTWNKLLKD